jgi:hypothetical protein
MSSHFRKSIGRVAYFAEHRIWTRFEMASTSVQGGADATSTQMFADGMLQLLKPVVTECDTRMQAVFVSQNQLSDQIDQLATGSLILLEDSHLLIDSFLHFQS